MFLEIPATKNSEFDVLFFNSLSQGLEDLAMETDKWPDQIIFHGKIGKELFDLLADRGWDLSRFNPTYVDNVVNKIVIQYSKPLDQIEDRGYAKGETLDGKITNGIPSSETMSKIVTASISPVFTIKRQIRPKLEIRLKRK